MGGECGEFRDGLIDCGGVELIARVPSLRDPMRHNTAREKNRRVTSVPSKIGASGMTWKRKKYTKEKSKTAP
jgi:hypothetical protein